MEVLIYVLAVIGVLTIGNGVLKVIFFFLDMKHQKELRRKIYEKEIINIGKHGAWN